MIASIIGWIGTIAFIICVLPQSIQCIKQKHAVGINDFFLILFTIGQVSYCIYGLMIDRIPIFVNNIIGLIFTLIIIWYRLFPARKEKISHG